MPKAPSRLLEERRSGYARRANGRSSEELKRLKAWHKELARMPWSYGPQCQMPVPSFAPGVARQIADAFFGQPGENHQS